MSNTSDFQAFAVGSGANVETPTVWAADTVLAQGFQSGILASAKLNTAIRQSSSIAAMIAKFMADYGPGNVLDNGVVSTLEAQFIAALGELIGVGVYKATDTGSADALAIAVAGLAALSAGQCFIVKKSASANTGSATININGLGAISVVWPDGTALASGDWPASVTGLVEYDGVQFNLLSVMGPSVYARKSYAESLSPKGELQAAAFTSGQVISDMTTAGTYYTVQTLSITGASWIQATSSCNIQNTSSTLTGVTSVIQLYDTTAGAQVSLSPYLGGFTANSIGLPMSASGAWRGLNPAHTYALNLFTNKSASAGPTPVFDGRISANYGA